MEFLCKGNQDLITVEMWGKMLVPINLMKAKEAITSTQGGDGSGDGGTRTDGTTSYSVSVGFLSC